MYPPCTTQVIQQKADPSPIRTAALAGGGDQDTGSSEGRLCEEAAVCEPRRVASEGPRLWVTAM